MRRRAVIGPALLFGGSYGGAAERAARRYVG
jgi:hypothetical protein